MLSRLPNEKLTGSPNSVIKKNLTHYTVPTILFKNLVNKITSIYFAKFTYVFMGGQSWTTVGTLEYRLRNY